MRHHLTLLAAATGVAALALTPTIALAGDRTGKTTSSSSSGLRAIGLVEGKRLVSFTTDRPKATSPVGTIGGLVGGDKKIVGIDYRVQDGKLYGVGDKGGVYTLDTKTAKATFVLRLSVALEGTTFGVDFNPAANALRVVSDTGQNLRQPFATVGAATVADTPLSTPPTVGGTLGVSAAAYTNNDLDADTGTTLYDLNTAADSLLIQAPANNGTLSATGNLRVDAGSDAGLDIYSKIRKGSTVDVTAFATLTVDGSPRLYKITLFNGRATLAGTFSVPVTDLAIGLAQR